MANNIYLTIKGKKQGLISAGCCTLDSIGNKYQSTHKEQILVLQFDHAISRSQHTNHHPIKFCKPIDKSSPSLVSPSQTMKHSNSCLTSTVHHKPEHKKNTIPSSSPERH